jgi:hypothetical protein
MCMRSNDAYCIEDPVSIKKSASFRSYSDSKREPLSVSCGIKNYSVPCVRIKCAHKHFLEYILTSFILVH